ncbi:MAG TPA: hypothetical protein VM899_13585 [Rubellimicrobium sp.]|nr:hypothetical protein [Rubellimicrobium sp.]
MAVGLEAWREAHGATSESLGHVESLTRALWELAHEHPVLGSSDPTSGAIMSLIVVIEEKAKQASERHGQEYRIRHAEADVSATPERGK